MQAEMTSQQLAPHSSSTESIPERLVFGHSAVMQEVRKSVHGVAGASVPVLITGKVGTGKEVIGREIHRLSPWRAAQFVQFSSASQIDAFSKGRSGQPYALLPADIASSIYDSRWTLFIREVGELGLLLQASLLELFQDRSVTTGSDGSLQPGGVRVICSSSVNLEDKVASGNFRLDLFYRINVVVISLPPLRDRKEDVPDLVEYFLEQFCREKNCTCPRVSGDLLRMFCRHDWPGNISELQNCIRIYVTTGGNAALAEAFLSKAPIAQDNPTTPLGTPIPLKTFKRQLIEQAERDLILQVLQQQRWNRKEAAKVLQVSYQTLLHKLRHVGLGRKTRPRSDVADQPVQE
jgi:DNA-binding NtrC family response regulator